MSRRGNGSGALSAAAIAGAVPDVREMVR